MKTADSDNFEVIEHSLQLDHTYHFPEVYEIKRSLRHDHTYHIEVVKFIQTNYSNVRHDHSYINAKKPLLPTTGNCICEINKGFIYDLFQIEKDEMTVAAKSEEINIVWSSINLEKEGRVVLSVVDDGNCFFRCISKHLFNTESYHERARSVIVNFMKDEVQFFERFFKTIEPSCVEEYFHEKLQSEGRISSRATEVEIFATATLLQQDIYVYSKHELNYKWTKFSPLYRNLPQYLHSPKVYISLANFTGSYMLCVQKSRKCNCSRSPPVVERKGSGDQDFTQKQVHAAQNLSKSLDLHNYANVKYANTQKGDCSRKRRADYTSEVSTPDILRFKLPILHKKRKTNPSNELEGDIDCVYVKKSEHGLILLEQRINSDHSSEKDEHLRSEFKKIQSTFCPQKKYLPSEFQEFPNTFTQINSTDFFKEKDEHLPYEHLKFPSLLKKADYASEVSTPDISRFKLPILHKKRKTNPSNELEGDIDCVYVKKSEQGLILLEQRINSDHSSEKDEHLRSEFKKFHSTFCPQKKDLPSEFQEFPNTCTQINSTDFSEEKDEHLPSEHLKFSSLSKKDLQSECRKLEIHSLSKKDLGLQSECRKLGIHFEAPLPNDSTRDKALRHRRNHFRIDRKLKRTLKNLIKFDDIPNPPPASADAHFNLAMDSIRAFELKQLTYSFSSCCKCCETRLNMKMETQDECYRCFQDKSEIKMFSADNKMDPGSVPSELRGLTLVEQQLIARISPVGNVHILEHGAKSSIGHYVTFPQEIDEPAQILPRLPQELNITQVCKSGESDNSEDFSVHRYRVQSALIWLKQYNPSYANIIICEHRLDLLPVDGQIAEIPSSEYVLNTSHTNDMGPVHLQTDSGDISCESKPSSFLPDLPVDFSREVEGNVVQDIVEENPEPVSANRRGHVYIPWPKRHETPVSEFTTQHFFTMAFPCLFPYGIGDFYSDRPRICKSMLDWAEHLMWYKDGRFARHHYFKFIVHNILRRKQILDSSSNRDCQKQGNQQIGETDLEKKLEQDDICKGKKKLRGTAQYWSQKSNELRALVQFQINEGKGLPAFFATGSCAEFHFKPLRQLLQRYLHETDGLDCDLEDRNNLYRAIQQNSHIVAHYFDLRTQDYFEEVMRPVFGVETYWYRQEFAKSTGMIHWHGLCWHNDSEPHNRMYEALQRGLSDKKCAQSLSEWAKSMFGMTACHPAGKDDNGESRKDLWPPPEGTAPSPPEEKNPLAKLLMDVSSSSDSLLEDHILLTNCTNIHQCSEYCLTIPDKICRMDFGRQSSPGKPLRCTPAIVSDGNGCLQLEMERDHPFLVQHSKYHTQGWRANGDISLILSKSPPENPSVQDILAAEKYISGYACKGYDPTCATEESSHDMFITADETAGAATDSELLARRVGRPISSVEASFELFSLPLCNSSSQFKSVCMSGSRVLEQTGLPSKASASLCTYQSRDAKFCTSWYNYICQSGKVPVISSNNVQLTWPLSEDYCRSMLLLHYPNWRTLSDIKDENISWACKMNEFLESDACPNFVKADVERAKQHAKVEIKEEDADADAKVVEIKEEDADVDAKVVIKEEDADADAKVEIKEEDADADADAKVEIKEEDAKGFFDDEQHIDEY